MRFNLITLFTSFALGVACNASADRVDDYIKTAMARQHIPGLALTVIRDGKVVKSRGYGLASVELRVPVTTDSAFELASLTKSFVATAVFLLKQDGKLTLDDKLSMYVGGLPDAWKSITIRHLLSHTSGIPDYINDLRHDFAYDASPEDVVKIAASAPLKAPPGAKWLYSNTDYVLLGMIIHKVTGQTYDAFLADRVFKPLGMSETRRDFPDEVIRNRVSGYLWAGAGGLHNANFLAYMETNRGDAGIVSTVTDLAKWDAALSSNHMLTDATKKEMWSPITLADGSIYSHGLGWFLDKANGHLHISHAGGGPGEGTILDRYPDDGLTVIILTNGGAENVFALDNGVAQCFVPALGPQGIVHVDERILDSYTGYCNVWGGTALKVTREADSLVVDDGGNFTGAFMPISQSKFVGADRDCGMTFTTDDRGQVSALSIRLVDAQIEAQVIGPLAKSIAPRIDPDTARTIRIEKILKAFELGGQSVEAVEGVAPQARADYAHGPAPEFLGMKSITYLAEFDVAKQKIERHGGSVDRVLYYKLLTSDLTRFVLVYLDRNRLVTDEDVVDE